MAHQTGKRNTAPLIATPAPLDEVADIRVSHRSYGEGQYPGPVSVPPGKTVTSSLADNLRQSASANTVGDFDVLDAVQAHGTGRNSSDFGLAPQTRGVDTLGKGAAPAIRSGMSRQQDPTILARKDQLPAKIGTDDEQPARQPK